MEVIAIRSALDIYAKDLNMVLMHSLSRAYFLHHNSLHRQVFYIYGICRSPFPNMPVHLAPDISHSLPILLTLQVLTNPIVIDITFVVKLVKKNGVFRVRLLRVAILPLS